MNKKQIIEWQQRIEDTFVGKRGIVGGDNLADLLEYEKRMSSYLLKEYNGHVLLMDAFFDFYIETMRRTAMRTETIWPDNKIVFTLTHIATLWRFRVSYFTFWNGYFVDAESLLRAVLENALSIAALHMGIVSFKEMFGDGAIEQGKNRSVDETYKAIRARIMECDRKIQSEMIGSKSGLSLNAQEDFRLFVQGLHMAVHKSQTTFLWGFKKWLTKQPLSFFPSWDEGLASSYVNNSMFLGWMITKTFPLLQLTCNEFSNGWNKKYKVLDQSFKEAVANFPEHFGRTVEELIEKKFDFRNTY
jgi:hypothetical protein